METKQKRNGLVYSPFIACFERPIFPGRQREHERRGRSSKAVFAHSNVVRQVHYEWPVERDNYRVGRPHALFPKRVCETVFVLGSSSWSLCYRFTVYIVSYLNLLFKSIATIELSMRLSSPTSAVLLHKHHFRQRAHSTLLHWHKFSQMFSVSFHPIPTEEQSPRACNNFPLTFLIMLLGAFRTLGSLSVLLAIQYPNWKGLTLGAVAQLWGFIPTALHCCGGVVVLVHKKCGKNFNYNSSRTSQTMEGSHRGCLQLQPCNCTRSSSQWKMNEFRQDLWTMSRLHCVWEYESAVPEKKKRYTKTNPLCKTQSLQAK